MEGDGFAEEVGVGGEVDGQIFKEMAAVLVERGEEAAAKFGGHGFIAAEVPDPDPRERAESDFESAGPIDAALKRVLVEPGFELGKEFGKVFGLAVEQMGLGEEDKVLVAAEFPDEFVIADGVEVEVFDAAEILEGGGFVVGVIAAPIDGRAGFEG